MNLHDVAKVFATDDDAHEALIKARWPKGIRCMACDSDRISRITSKGKTGKTRRVLECLECGWQFTATSGTLFHDSHLPLRKWFMAIALICEAKKGLSALQLSRHLGVQHKTAWYLNHRIREAMQEENPKPLGSEGQVVEIDEVFIGGKKRNAGVKAGRDAKIKVLGMVERGTGRIHLQVIPDTKLASIKPVVDANLSPNASRVVTDSHAVYSQIIPFEKHNKGNHKEELWNHGTITSTRTIDGAFSLLKRGLVGSFHKISGDHIDAYLHEFCWRYSRRTQQPMMFGELLTNVTKGKPLTYKRLTREMF
jgi:transposase-like protein